MINTHKYEYHSVVNIANKAIRFFTENTEFFLDIPILANIY